jgi:hypothetical protein
VEKEEIVSIKIGDRVRVKDQDITGTVLRYDVGNKVVILDDDRDDWVEDDEEGELIFSLDNLFRM